MASSCFAPRDYPPPVANVQNHKVYQSTVCFASYLHFISRSCSIFDASQSKDLPKGRWEVVGGAKGGVLVRDGQSTTSEQCLGMKVFPFLCGFLRNWFSRRFWNQPCSIMQNVQI